MRIPVVVPALPSAAELSDRGQDDDEAEQDQDGAEERIDVLDGRPLHDLLHDGSDAQQGRHDAEAEREPGRLNQPALQAVRHRSCTPTASARSIASRSFRCARLRRSPLL